jgi:putative hydrolase of the HAD superfamily
MMSIKAISFDLDDTLWPILPVINKAEEITNKWLVKNYPGVEKLLKGKELADIRNKLLEKRRNLANNLSKLRELSLVELGIRSGYNQKESEIMAAQSFKIFYSYRNQVTLYEGVERSLIKLKNKYLLGVITNGNANLKEIGIDHYFHFNFNAYEMNTSKPDLEIFQAAIKKTGFMAKEICHVGDHPVNDVQGSLNAGMHAIWFNEKGIDWPFEAKPNFKEVSSWNELEKTLEKF